MALSITIPTYNRQVSVLGIIRSLLPQLLEEDELLVVDDASPDLTAEAVRTISRVRCVRNPANIGMVRNWNEAVRLASNPWICMIHDDDEVATDALSTIRHIIDLLGGRPCAIAGGGLDWSEHKGLRFHYYEPGQYAVLRAPKIPSGVTVHKDIFDSKGLFDERFTFSADLEFFPRIAKDFAVAFIDSPTVVRYRVHGTNYQFKTWRDPLFLNQLEQIVQLVGGYAGFTDAALSGYVASQMTGFLKHIMRWSRLQDDLETYRKISRLLVGRPQLGRRAWTMAQMGSLLGWCPRMLVRPTI